MHEVKRLAPIPRHVRSQELDYELHVGPDNLGLVSRYRPRADEVSLDPTLLDAPAEWTDHDDGSMQLVAYAALAVTVLLFVALLWPWINGWFA